MSSTPAPPSSPPVSIADVFIGHLASRDFTQLATLFEPDVSFSALLPDGLREWHGPEQVMTAFVGWFGRVDECEILEAAVDHVGPRLQLGGGPGAAVTSAAGFVVGNGSTPTPDRPADRTPGHVVLRRMSTTAAEHACGLVLRQLRMPARRRGARPGGW
jgi:hypothetical protein